MGKILKIGVPVTLQDGFIQVSFIIITIIANRRGLADAAAVGIVEKIMSFLFLIPSSMLSTVSALGAQNIGARKPERAIQTLRCAVLLAASISFVIAVGVQFIAETIVALFTDLSRTDGAEVIRLGGQYLRGYVWDCFFAGMQFSFSGYFCAIGRSGFSFLHNRELDKTEEKLRRQKAIVAEKLQELRRIEQKIDAQMRRLCVARSTDLGRIEIVSMPPCRIFWTENRTTAQEPESFELSTSQLAAAQTEPIIFLGKVGFSISEEHLKARQYDQYDGAFLLLDDADRFDGAILSLPETTCVRVRFRGHHLQSPEQYRRLEAFMQEHHLQICGFSREITLIDYGITNDTEKFVTEICIPVECK